MANNPSLLVFTPVTGTSTFIEDITPYVTDYSHSIRLRGGFWTANWKMSRETMPRIMYNGWLNNRIWCHLEEWSGGHVTWEGSIETIQADDESGVIDATAYGYVHSIQSQYNSTTDTGTTDADKWISTLVSTDCPLIQEGYYEPNTLQCYKAGNEPVWDEMLKVVELGGGSAPIHPWRLGVYRNRRLYYQAVSNTPIGYIKGGMRWRVDAINDLHNSIIVRYTDETGASSTDIFDSSTESIAKYGTREMRLERSYLPTATATALASAYLYEHMWPYMRAVGCGQDIQVYDNIGCDIVRSPWEVRAGVYRDMSMMPSNAPYLSWLTQSNDFLVDEVIATSAGVKFRTSSWTESDAIDAYYDYLRSAPQAPPKQKKRKRGGKPPASGKGQTKSTGTTGRTGTRQAGEAEDVALPT